MVGGRRSCVHIDTPSPLSFPRKQVAGGRGSSRTVDARIQGQRAAARNRPGIGHQDTSRAAKATLIDKILETTGGGSGDSAAPPSTNGRAAKAAKESAPATTAARSRGRPRPPPVLPTTRRRCRTGPSARPAARRADEPSHPRARWRAAGRLGDRADQVRRGRGHRTGRLAGRVRGSTALRRGQGAATATMATATMVMPRAATAAADADAATRAAATELPGRRAGALRAPVIARTTRPGPPLSMEPVRSPVISTCATRATASSGSTATCASRDDAYIPVKLTRQYGLRKGDYVTGLSRAGRAQREEPGDARRSTPSTASIPRRPRHRPRVRGPHGAVPGRAAAPRERVRPQQHDGPDHRPHLADRQGPARHHRVAAEGRQDDDHEDDRHVDRAQPSRGRS